MSAKILRLGLQFFANSEEEKDNVIDGEGGVPTDTTGGAAPLTVPTYTPPAAPTKDDYDTWAEKNGIVGEQGFYDMNGLDPDRDYQDRVNTLNYEYQTSLANYGQNAERLYQMGLSNSGVSDIFGANAFSAYLSNMNTAASERIAARKQNKAQYQAYVQGKKGEWQQYADAFDAEEDAKLNAAMNYALSSFNGYNSEDIIEYLTASGYHQGILDQVTERLGALGVDKLKGQTAQELAATILQTLPNYRGSDADLQMLQTMFGATLSKDAIEDAHKIASAMYNSSPDGQAQLVQDLVNTWTPSFDPNMSKDEFVNEMITKDGKSDESQRANAEAAWEQMGAKWDSDLMTVEDFIFKNYKQGEEWVNKQLSGRFSENLITKAWDNFKISNEGKQWQESQTQASVDSLVNTWTPSFDPNTTMDEFLGKKGIVTDPNAEGFDQAAYDNAVKAWEKMKAEYDDKYNSAYTAALNRGLNANSTDEAFKFVFEQAGIEYNDALIEKVRGGLRDTQEMLDEEDKVQKETTAGEVVSEINNALDETKENNGFLSAGDYLYAYNQVVADEQTNGETDASREAKSVYKGKILTSVTGFVLGSEDCDLSDAPEKLGSYLPQDVINSWDSMSDDQRRRSILETALNHKDITLSASEKQKLVGDYISWKTEDIISTDKNNAKASGLADAGELVTYINGLGLRSDERKALINDIISQMQFTWENNQISWYGTVEGAEATIRFSNDNKVVEDEDLISTLNAHQMDTKGFLGINQAYATHKGKLFHKSGSAWQEIPVENLLIIGDGHSNTPEQAEGIYNLLVYMLEFEAKKNTDSGYVEGQLPSSGAISPGGTVTLREDHNYYQSKTTGQGGGLKKAESR